MNTYLSLPLDFLTFWFFAAPKEMIAFFSSLNRSYLRMFSIPLFLRTFFQPIKNEYREGLVGFSIVMGMVVKSVLLFFGIVGLLILLVIECLIMATFILFPIMSIAVLFH